jgi:hypothetical protein
MNGFNSGQRIFIRIEMVIGGPIKFMKNTLATVGIISQLSRGVLMLFIAHVLRQH